MRSLLLLALLVSPTAAVADPPDSPWGPLPPAPEPAPEAPMPAPDPTEAEAPPPVLEGSVDTPPSSPWSFDYRAGFGLQLLSNQGVIGAEPGITVAGSISAWAGARFRKPHDGWSAGLAVDLGFFDPPGPGPAGKTMDLVVFETLYAWNPTRPSWLAPMISGRMALNLLPVGVGSDGRVAEVRTVDGTPISSRAPLAGTRLRLSGSAEPVVITELLGIRIKPLDIPAILLDWRLGPAGQHIVARDGVWLDRAASTDDTLVARPYRTSHSVGAATELRVSGDIKGWVDWGGKALVFVPLATSPLAPVRGPAGTSAELRGWVGLRLGPVLTLSYVLDVRYLPMVADVWQVHNGVQLSTGCACR